MEFQLRLLLSQEYKTLFCNPTTRQPPTPSLLYSILLDPATLNYSSLLQPVHTCSQFGLWPFPVTTYPCAKLMSHASDHWWSECEGNLEATHVMFNITTSKVRCLSVYPSIHILHSFIHHSTNEVNIHYMPCILLGAEDLMVE